MQRIRTSVQRKVVHALREVGHVFASAAAKDCLLKQVVSRLGVLAPCEDLGRNCTQAHLKRLGGLLKKQERQI
jgi:hypothetical protein